MVRLCRLDVEALSLKRGSRRLFRNLSFSLNGGEAIVFTGENGAGKTSLLRAIAGLLQPETGRILFKANGMNIEGSEAIRRQTHFVGHKDGLASSRSVRSEIEFATAWTWGSRTSAFETAERIGLTRLLDLPISKLSAGQRRRVAMVRLVSSPRALWLLDEPNTALDAAGRAWLRDAMQAHLSSDGLILAATHEAFSIDAPVIEIGG